MSSQLKKRYPFVTAVHWFAFNPQGEVLLSRRFQTGYKDGQFSLPAGHVEGGETATEALIREVREEVGVVLSPQDLTFAHVMHRNNVTEPFERIDFFFTTHNFVGEYENKEPQKCDLLAWYHPNKLPATMVEYVENALGQVLQKKAFSEFLEEI